MMASKTSTDSSPSKSATLQVSANVRVAKLSYTPQTPGPKPLLLLENADVGVAQVLYGAFGGGRIHRVVVGSWSRTNRGSIHVAGCCVAERVAHVGTGVTPSAAYGMPGR